MEEVQYVIWLRTRPHVATKKVNGVTVQRYWVNAITADTIFTLREQLTSKERSEGRKAKTILVSAISENVDIVR